MAECEANNIICDVHAVCIKNSSSSSSSIGSSYECQCHGGYDGDGRTCIKRQRKGSPHLKDTWRFSVVHCMNEVNLRRARLVLGSTRMGDRLQAVMRPRYITKLTRSTQPCIPAPWTRCFEITLERTFFLLLPILLPRNIASGIGNTFKPNFIRYYLAIRFFIFWTHFKMMLFLQTADKWWNYEKKFTVT